MLTGTARVDEFLAHAATMHSFATEAVTLPGALVFQALFEIRIGGRQVSLPPGLHPTNPPTFVVQAWRCPDTPWGPLAVSQGRVGSRSGLRPRGFVQSCVCDNPAAIDAFRSRWGYPAQFGEVSLRQGYDAAFLDVSVGGTMSLSLTATNPEPLAPEDVSYSTSVALAHTPRGERLVQIDTELVVVRAERVRARLAHYDGVLLGVHPSVQPYYPVAATIATADITIERLRYVNKPAELAFTGTEPAN